MPNPGKVSFHMQLAVFEGALAASHGLSVRYLRLLSRQQQLFADGPLRRNGDGRNRHLSTSCTGADLQTHYGHRHLDVDVERL